MTPPSNAKFDLVVVGAGGGPSEANLSGYLLKTHASAWSDGIVGIEAGSGLGALQRILQEKPNLFSNGGEPGPDAIQVYSCLRTYLITHAHLDHVLSLVLLAGSMGGQRKSIRGSRQCLEDLETIFKPNRIWPNLASWNPDDSDDLYLYDPLPEEPGEYTSIHRGISVSRFPLSHGENYTSAAFFIRHDAIGHEFLFFGDVESDKVADASQPRIRDVWRAAAPKIVDSTLDTIFIECSWPSGRPDDKLYGHLCPEHLVSELEVLAAAVVSCRRNASATGPDSSATVASRKRASSTASPERKRPRQISEPGSNVVLNAPEGLQGALAGLRVYIIHCKEDVDGKYPGRPIHLVISEQVRNLVEEKGLGATILAAEQGSLIHI